MPRPPDSGVWQEVRRRRVMKVVIAYLGLAFGALEIVLFLAPTSLGSDLAVRAVLGFLVMGFPLAVVLAWTYDITPSGVVKTPDEVDSADEIPPTRHVWVMLAILGAGIGIALELLR